VKGDGIALNNKKHSKTSKGGPPLERLGLEWKHERRRHQEGKYHINGGKRAEHHPFSLGLVAEKGTEE